MATRPLIAPDGRSFDVPEEHVEEALAAGWTPPPAPDMAPAPALEGGASAAVETQPPAQSQRVRVRAPDGSEGSIPSSNLQAAMDAGWEPVVSTGEKIRTGLESLASGVSVGVSDIIQAGGAGLGSALGSALAEDVGGAAPVTATRGVGAPTEPASPGLFDTGAFQESLEGIRTRETASPTLAAVAKVAGGIGAAVLSGGTSGAAQAARLTPAGYASVLAARVQAALAPRAAGALGRIGALAAAGATENAVQRATREVVDGIASGDTEITAERLVGGLGGVLEDAALGALTGGVIGGAIEGSQAAYRMGREMLASRKLAQDTAAATPDLVLDMSQGPAAAAENAGPLTVRELPSLADNTNSQIVQAARGAAQDFGETQQAAVKSIGDDIDELMRIHDISKERAGIAAKRAYADQVKADMPTAERAFNAAREMLEEVELSAKSMIDEFGADALQRGGGLTALKHVETAAKSTLARMTHQLQNGDLGSAFMTLNDFKALVGEAQNARNSLSKGRMRGLYERVRTHLEDEGLYGELATKQRPVNAGITETIRRKSDDLVRRFFRTSGEAGDDPFELLTQSNRESIGALLNSLGKEEVRPAEKALRLYLRSLAVDAEARAAAWGTPELFEQAKLAKRLVGRAEAQMNAVGFARQDQKAWEKISSYATGSAGGILRGAAKVAQVAASPIERMAKAAVKQQQAVAEAADATRNVLLGAASPRALQGTVSAQRVQSAVNQARALEDPQSAESARLRQASHELAQDDPFMAQALEQKQRQKAAFLAEKAGPLANTADPFARGPAPMDKVSAQKLSSYAAALEEPGEALRRVAQGGGSPEDLEVLQKVYPRLYGTYVQLVQQQMARAIVPPTTAQRQRLHRATGIPMAPEQQPDALVFLQTAGNPPPPEPEPETRGRPMNIDPDKHFASRSDQILAGGE